MPFVQSVYNAVHLPIFASPALALAFTSLSLLLLVLVLQSVPGPIHGMYWFSIPGEHTGSGRLLGGVMGWCMNDFANCTYSPLSDNDYLADKIDAGQALTVRIMMPLACYWMIVTLAAWVLLAITAPRGYTIKNLDSISRHLYFGIVEASVICISLFGNVLCWLAFGLGREAYITIKAKSEDVKTGQAMEVAAVAALVSHFSLFAAVWGLRLRLQSAQKQWKQEAVMVRRRSMAMSAAGVQNDGRGNRLSVQGDIIPLSDDEKKRWSLASNNDMSSQSHNSYMAGLGFAPQGKRSSASHGDEEERLDDRLAAARRNSIEHATVQRASVIGMSDDPYAMANSAHRHDHPNA